MSQARRARRGRQAIANESGGLVRAPQNHARAGLLKCSRRLLRCTILSVATHIILCVDAFAPSPLAPEPYLRGHVLLGCGGDSDRTSVAGVAKFARQNS